MLSSYFNLNGVIWKDQKHKHFKSFHLLKFKFIHVKRSLCVVIKKHEFKLISILGLKMEKSNNKRIITCRIDTYCA